jgi:hypothetical protein
MYQNRYKNINKMALIYTNKYNDHFQYNTIKKPKYSLHQIKLITGQNAIVE